jgi:hypothetical protein
MSNPNENKKEKIYDNITQIKEEIWETKEYISSDNCRKCSEMYTKLSRLEQNLIELQRKLDNECA